MSEPDFYIALQFPDPPGDRPYIFINMVATIDGKTVSGDRGEPVQDLGSSADHLMMRRIQAAADAVLIGATSQRSSPKINYDPRLYRFVASKSGNVLRESRFFTDAPDKAFVISSDNWGETMRDIRERYPIRYLLVEGGSELNAQLLREDLVDELFLTIAPKVKLGENTPTYAAGVPLLRERIQQYEIVELHRWQNEVFLRYRRQR